MIDLHGAPSSQNGYDNSGHNGTAGWSADPTSVADTRAVLQQISNKYARPSYQDVVVGIELLNEPLPSKLPKGTDAIVQYYKDGYGDVRVVSDTPVIIHDAFQEGPFWDGVLTSPGAEGVIIDHHEYQVFTDDLVSLTPAVSAALPQLTSFDLNNLNRNTCRKSARMPAPTLVASIIG